MEYFYERYGENGGRTEVGMLQRYLQAENAIRYKKKQDRARIAFFLYPALVRYSRNFLARYYVPDGKGYLKTKAHFEASC
jgi:hypothetical protein